MERIGVIGAYGAVGTALATALAAQGHRLRLGGRDQDRTAALADRLSATPATVDLDDRAALDRFVDGCHLVVNCAGPSCLIGATVAVPALAAGAAYVDVAGDEPLLRTLAGADRPVVLAAGLAPGLTGLLPRWLAGRLPEPPVRLRAWCGGLERFTPAAAADMVAGTVDGHGESMAAWRDGAVARHALPALTDTELPPFPGRVAVYPYLSAETRRVAAALGLRHAEWHHVFAGTRTLAALNQLRADADPVRGAARLVAAADLDLAGLSPYQLLVVELSGATTGRTVTVHADDGYRLTAAVGVAAVEAVLRGAVPPGPHLADQVLDPETVVAAITTTARTHLTTGPATELVEEGSL